MDINLNAEPIFTGEIDAFGDKVYRFEDIPDEDETEQTPTPMDTIPNNYIHKTPSEVWGKWDAAQRVHFLADHAEFIEVAKEKDDNLDSNLSVYKDMDYFDLPDPIKGNLIHHIMWGQYEKGGKPHPEKVEKVMHEFKAGTLKSHGKKVTDRDQAIAIALSEAGLSRKKEEGGTLGEDIYRVEKIPNESRYGIYVTNPDYMDSFGGSTILVATRNTKEEAEDYAKNKRYSKEKGGSLYEKGSIVKGPDSSLYFEEYLDKHSVSSSKKNIAMKQYAKIVKIAYDQEVYIDMIVKGDISAVKARNIMLEQGFEIPKDIVSAANDEEKDMLLEREGKIMELESFKANAIIAEPISKQYTKEDLLHTIEGYEVLLESDQISKEKKEEIRDAIGGMEVLLESIGDTMNCGGYILKKGGIAIQEIYNH